MKNSLLLILCWMATPYCAHTQSIIITEFMADPTPVVALPNAEYVEVYNAAASAVSLQGLAIASGGRSVDLITPQTTLAAGGYALIVDADDSLAFAAPDRLLLLTNLPALSNGGDEITILQNGDTLDHLRYAPDWYNDPERDDGGYSLEFAGGDDRNCPGNWRASLDERGGTPGAVNSVQGMRADRDPPRIVTTEIDADGLYITFDEAVIGSFDGLLFIDDQPIPTVFIDPFTVRATFPVVPSRLYRVSILPDFSDCAQNFPGEEIRLSLALPEAPLPGELVINEILFNPAVGGSDFIELYNCSEKVFQIRNWRLENTTASGSGRDVEVDHLMLPKSYLVLSSDTADIASRYEGTDPAALIETSLPSLPDERGNISVFDERGLLLDAFDYDEDYHLPLLSPNDGVSLERLRTKSPTQDRSNWFSAASSVGYATPTQENSQARSPVADLPDLFTLNETTFSPDGDGYQDILEVTYRVDQAGLLARISIFDVQGRPIRTLERITLLGTEGTLRWDGISDEGRLAQAGVYVLLVELFSPDGRTDTRKLVAVLAG